MRVFRRAGWRCEECGAAGRLECDHIVPISQGGGEWDTENYQALCRACHLHKSRLDSGMPAGFVSEIEAWEKHRRERQQERK